MLFFELALAAILSIVQCHIEETCYETLQVKQVQKSPDVPEYRGSDVEEKLL